MLYFQNCAIYHMKGIQNCISMKVWKIDLSTVECSLVQLSIEIDLIYQILTENAKFSMSRNRLAIIQHQIVSGSYVLNPQRVKHIHKVDLTQFLSDTLPDCPEIMLWSGSDPDIFIVGMPDEEDILVVMALSLMLLHLSYGGLLEDGYYRLENLDEPFYDSLHQIGKVDRLVKLDLNESSSIIPIRLIYFFPRTVRGISSLFLW